MDELRIRLYGDPCLETVSEPIGEVDASLRELTEAMGEIMYATRGIGLAAPQVGINRRLFVMDTEWASGEEDGKQEGEKDLRVFINPEITWESVEDAPLTEGCLSLPEIEGEVYRPIAVRMRYKDLDGVEYEELFEDLPARCVQHEFDHLDGVLFVDRMARNKRRPLAGKLSNLRKKTRMEMSSA